MDLAEQLLPEPAAVAKGPELEPGSVETLRELLRQVVAQVREQRPEPNSPAETKVLERMSAFGFEAVGLLGPAAFVDVMRAGLYAASRDVLRIEFESADIERKLALRQIEQAVHTFGVLMESFGAVLKTVSGKTVGAALAELSSAVPHAPMRAEDRTVTRFQVELLVALECIDAPVDELTYWAFRAINSARTVESLPPESLFGELRGELARVRARHAWDDWDEQEAQKEIAPWPILSR